MILLCQMSPPRFVIGALFANSKNKTSIIHCALLSSSPESLLGRILSTHGHSAVRGPFLGKHAGKVAFCVRRSSEKSTLEPRARRSGRGGRRFLMKGVPVDSFILQKG